MNELRSTMQAKAYVLIGCIYCLSFAASSQVTWKRVYGGYDVDNAYDIISTDDGGLIIIGSTGSFGVPSASIYCLKLDSFGELLWSRTIGDSYIHQVHSLTKAENGNFVIVGLTDSPPSIGYDALVVKIDSEGTVIWSQNYGGTQWDRAHDITVLSDGSYVFSGISYGYHPAGEAWATRILPNGEFESEYRLGYLGFAEAYSIVATLDGGYIMTGKTYDDLNSEDLLVVKLSSENVVEWAESFGGTGSDIGRDVIQTLEGGYSIVGVTQSFAEFPEMWHLKISSSGDYEWDWNWGQVSHQEAFKHLQLDDGNYASIGFVTQGGQGGKDMFLLKSNQDGSFNLGQTQGGVADDIGYSIVRVDGGYVLCGVSNSFGLGITDVFVVRTNEVGFTDDDNVVITFDPVNVPELHYSENLKVSPNPTSGQIWLDRELKEVVITDVFGRKVFQSIRPDYPINTNLSIGTYLLKATDFNDHIANIKLLVE